MPVPRFIIGPVLFLTLVACQNLEEEANEAGCWRFTPNIEVIFIGGGQMREVENRIARYLKKYGLNREPFAKSAVGGKSAEAAMMAAEHFLNGIERDQSGEPVAKGNYGDLMDKAVGLYEDDYSFKSSRLKFFADCKDFVSRKLNDTSYLSHLENLYRHPPE